MKKLLIILFMLVGSYSGQSGQKDMFVQFLNCFPDVDLPFVANEFSQNSFVTIPHYLALKYLCDNDSSFLYYRVVGRNQETMEVVYEEERLFHYRAFAKLENEGHFILIYDGYLNDGEHQFSTILNIGVFSKEGELISEMLFYVFDDTGKLQEQTGEITEDMKIIIKKKEYVKNEEGKNTMSYYDLVSSFKFIENSGRFKKMDEIRKFVQPD